MNIINHPSENFDDRAPGTRIDMLVIHTTCTETAQRALDILCDPARKVSAHYLIDRDGTIYNLVNEGKRAWHAGESFWRQETDLNSRSIGIEIQNSGAEDFPPAQMQALEKLCHSIIARRHIPPDRILAHSDIAPHRKQDPGENFNWKKLARHGIGLWPRPRLKDCFNNKAFKSSPKKLIALFKKAGYSVREKDGRPSLEETIIAFQRHYEPEVFKNPTTVGKATGRTLRRLKGLIRTQRKGA